jgi:UDPglucose 6-dehydrogenase
MKIAVIGTGYVGLSNAVLLAQHNTVVAVDIIQNKVDMINDRKSPIVDDKLEEYLATKQLDLTATTNAAEAYSNADFVIVATPTNYDTETDQFDTSSVEHVIAAALATASDATIVIKSTIPVGFTESIRKQYGVTNILFSPEFLREGKALHDNLYPSRIIVGDNTDAAHIFADLLREGALKKDIPTLFVDSTEAEAVKLFSNTYLAMRVAYFNELDTYAEIHGLNTKQIIDGVSLDPRIGDYYNNPSFGYGGYCLPKDTKQLRANFQDVPHTLISAIVTANTTRMKHIADQIYAPRPKVVGIYRLTMKTDSDNYRQSSIQGVIQYLKEYPIEVVVFEPTIKAAEFEGMRVITDLDEFKNMSDTVVANRITEEIADIGDKIYTRDLFSRD